MKITKKITHGVRGAELEAAIVELKRTPKTNMQPGMTLVFTLSGEEDELVDEQGESDPQGFPLLYNIEDKHGQITLAESLKNAYAKIVHSAGNIRGARIKYFIKTDGNGKYYDPLGLYSEGRHNKQIHYAGNNEYKFKEVNYKVCLFYLNFLKTRNKAYLLNANREAL